MTAPVRTLAEHVDVAVQLADQGGPPGFDRVIFNGLAAAYNSALSSQLIAGTGASGQVAGFLTGPGWTVTYTSVTPTVAATYSRIGELAATVATARQQTPAVCVMHPRRWFWLTTQADAQNRPFNPIDLAAPERDPNVEPVGSLAGMAVVVTPSIPTNQGAGTNEDRVGDDPRRPPHPRGPPEAHPRR